MVNARNGWRRLAVAGASAGSAQVLLTHQSRRAEAGSKNDGHNGIESDSAAICIAG